MLVCDGFVRVRLPEHHQPLRLRERQRLEQQGVDDAEDGGIGADAERQGDDGDRGESWARLQHADGVPDILHDGRENPGEPSM